MKRKLTANTLLKRAALTLSLCAVSVTGVAHAGSPYSSPSRWNHFRPALDDSLLDEASDSASELESKIQDLPAPRDRQPSRSNNLLLDSSSNSAAGGSSSRYPMGGYSNQGYSQPAPSYQAPTPAPPVTSSNGQVQGYQPAPMAVPGNSTYAPAPAYPAASYPAAPSYPTGPIVGSGPVSGSCGGNCGGNGMGGSHSVGSSYQHAMSAPWSGSGGMMRGSQNYHGGHGAPACGVNTNVRHELFPYFGNLGLTFWQMEPGSQRLLATGLGTDFTTSLVDPDGSVGYDVGMGRYFGCGKYGFGVNYMNWDPDSESITRVGTAGTIRAAMPQYRDVQMNFGTADTVYNLIDGTAVDSAGAAGIRMTRDLSFQGLEGNFYHFGLMGAQRASYAGCNDQSRLGSMLGLGRSYAGGRGAGYGYGGAAGPLVRSSGGRLRVMASHGFRWFQIKDASEIAYNIDGTPGYQIGDIYDRVETVNNLFGYQFGGILTYCLGSRLDLNIGGKFGIYGNKAELKHRLGSNDRLAYLSASGTDDINTAVDDTVLATLGELDLGFGLRVTNAWTVRAGYRVMGITGVANAIESYPQNYTSVAASGALRADDSYLLHGAYLGANFNW